MNRFYAIEHVTNRKSCGTAIITTIQLLAGNDLVSYHHLMEYEVICLSCILATKTSEDVHHTWLLQVASDLYSTVVSSYELVYIVYSFIIFVSLLATSRIIVIHK